MSTNDVPGYRPENRDELATGCWAEHADGSLIFVESTEGGRVVFSIFDMDKAPIVEYRDAMAEGGFKKAFSWDPKQPAKAEKWTWHDKSPFPWDRIIKAGGKDGTKHASADDQLNAAERVRRSREIHRGHPVDTEAAKTRIDTLGKKAKAILQRLQNAINNLPPEE